MSGPLTGIRILDFTIAQQGPYATLLLADMGAEVIKVEEPGKGEVGRVLGIDRATGFSAYFLAINRGKRSLTLDLKSDAGRDIALRLARDCDVVAHNFRPGVMEKLGLGYDAFRAVNPHVVFAEASAFGNRGPLGTKPGNDLLAQAMSGLMSVTGDGEAPVPAGAALADHVGALTFALGVVSALVHRARTGEGQRVTTSLLGSMMAAQSWELTHYMMTGELPAKAGRGHTHLLWQWYTYRTADGWLAVGGVDPTRWQAFCTAIGREDLTSDVRFDTAGKRIRARDELNALLDAHLSSRTTSEWLQYLEAADIFCAPVLDYSQVTNHEQAAVNDYIGICNHPKLGPVKVIASPIQFSSTPADSSQPESNLGADTAEVLRSAEYRDDEIDHLRRDGIV